MAQWFILDDDGNPKPATMLEAGEWLTGPTDKRRVASTGIGNMRVSTVFLVMNHNMGKGKPLLFETMAFMDGEALDGVTNRYATREEALIGHEKLVKALTTINDASVKVVDAVLGDYKRKT